MVRPLLPQQHIPILYRSPHHPPSSLLYNSEKPDFQRGHAGPEQAHRQLLGQSPETSHTDVGHGGAQLFRVPDPVPRVYAVDYTRFRGESIRTRLREILQHPVLLPDNGLFEFGG